jgi:hypothetical protein
MNACSRVPKMFGLNIRASVQNGGHVRGLPHATRHAVQFVSVVGKEASRAFAYLDPALRRSLMTLKLRAIEPLKCFRFHKA